MCGSLCPYESVTPNACSWRSLDHTYDIMHGVIYDRTYDIIGQCSIRSACCLCPGPAACRRRRVQYANRNNVRIRSPVRCFPCMMYKWYHIYDIYYIIDDIIDDLYDIIYIIIHGLKHVHVWYHIWCHKLYDIIYDITYFMLISYVISYMISYKKQWYHISCMIS